MGTPPGGQPLIYLQIARMLEDDILRGVYREEEQVPSTNELARAFRINPATAPRASTFWRPPASYISAGASGCSWPPARRTPIKRASPLSCPPTVAPCPGR